MSDSVSSASSESRSLLAIDINDSTPVPYHDGSDDDLEFISRRVLERSLLRKLDFRTAYLVLIYILNQVSNIPSRFICHLLQ
jgi:hypothetical protein